MKIKTKTQVLCDLIIHAEMTAHQTNRDPCLHQSTSSSSCYNTFFIIDPVLGFETPNSVRLSKRMEDKVDEEIYSTVTDIQDEPSPQSKEEEDDEPEEQQALTKSRLYLVGLGIFIGLIAGTLIYMSVRMVTVLENINHLTTKRMQLISETKTMEEEIVELNQEIDKKCEPCPNKWILFKNKCYLFYDSPPPWKTWEESQRFCQNKRTRLLTIGSLEEQEFVSKHIKYYHDEYHGYWIGLQHVSNSWTWITGNVDTLGFWMKENFTIPQSKALVVPGKNPSQSWKKAMNEFENKFICERDPRKP